MDKKRKHVHIGREGPSPGGDPEEGADSRWTLPAQLRTCQAFNTEADNTLLRIYTWSETPAVPLPCSRRQKLPESERPDGKIHVCTFTVFSFISAFVALYSHTPPRMSVFTAHHLTSCAFHCVYQHQPCWVSYSRFHGHTATLLVDTQILGFP